jgi:hypothetical protein
MVISDKLRNSLRMALCDDAAYAEMIAGFSSLGLQNRILFELKQTVTVAAHTTYVGSYKAILIPAGSFVSSFIIESGHVYGTALAAANTLIKYSIGTVANAGITLGGANEADVMIATGALHAANVHGDAAGDNSAAYFADVPVGKYFAADTVLYVNYIGEINGAGGFAVGTVNCDMNVYAMVTRLY